MILLFFLMLNTTFCMILFQTSKALPSFSKGFIALGPELYSIYLFVNSTDSADFDLKNHFSCGMSLYRLGGVVCPLKTHKFQDCTLKMVAHTLLHSTAHPPTTTSQMKNVCGFVDLRPTFQ